MNPPSPAAAVPGRPGSTLAVRLDLSSGRVELAGDLDRWTVHLLHDAVSTLLQHEHDRWELVVTGLLVWDMWGIRAIGAAYRRALVHGRTLAVVGAGPRLQDVLALLRLDPHVLEPGPPG